MNIAFFGSSLVSTYWNGAATYYRGILRALAQRGHRITFYEPDAFERQAHRDIENPKWAEVVVYPATTSGLDSALQRARDADLLVKASGVGVFDQELEREVLVVRRAQTLVAYWDVDAPATLERLKTSVEEPLRACVPRYDIVFTYGGGPRVVAEYRKLGARDCVPVYNALDPSTHHPVEPDARFAAALGFLGNRLPDRERRVEEFFLGAARRLPGGECLLGGSGWEPEHLPENVRYLGHVSSREHNAFNVTPLAVLNISRESMAAYGYSPATRVFEAAGAGACLITDDWEGVEQFLEPEQEVLVATSGEAVAEQLRQLTPERARAIGARARKRMLREHTYAQRALDVEAALDALRPVVRSSERSIALRSRPAPQASSSRAVAPKAVPQAVSNRRESVEARRGLNMVVLGLSLTSSWGNGHATTYRALLRALDARGHRVLFLERDVPWYASHRDLPDPPYGRLELYRDLTELKQRYADAVAGADVVIVGSYVPEGIEVGKWVVACARGVTAFYDIDTPVSLANLEAGKLDYLSRELIRQYQLYLSFTGGPMLQRLQQRYGAPRAVPLYCSVDPEHYYPEPGEKRWRIGYMGTYSPDRQPGLERLLFAPARALTDQPFVVAGPSYPQSVRWPNNVDWLPHLPPSEHRRFYNSSDFTLNLTRQAMTEAGYSPSVRLFEAAACGAPIISDRWEGIESFFEPGQEILLVQNTQDVLQYLQQFDERRLRNLAERARARVLAAHTAMHRAAELEQYVRQAATIGPDPRDRAVAS